MSLLVIAAVQSGRTAAFPREGLAGVTVPRDGNGVSIIARLLRRLTAGRSRIVTSDMTTSSEMGLPIRSSFIGLGGRFTLVGRTLA